MGTKHISARRFSSVCSCCSAIRRIGKTKYLRLFSQVTINCSKQAQCFQPEMCYKIYAFVELEKKDGQLIMKTGTSFFYNSLENPAKRIQNWAVESGFIDPNSSESRNKRLSSEVLGFLPSKLLQAILSYLYKLLATSCVALIIILHSNIQQFTREPKANGQLVPLHRDLWK